MGKIYIYYHADFDGACSAYLVFNLLKKIGYDPEIVDLVDYSMFTASDWEQQKIEIKKPACCVDFHYRPDVEVFFDHHAKKYDNISKETKIFIDVANPSCFEVILDYAKKNKIDLREFQDLEEIKKWCRIIDSALFNEYGIPPAEVILPTIPVLKIAKSMVSRNIPTVRLILEHLLAGDSLLKISQLDEIKQTAQTYTKSLEKILPSLKKKIEYSSEKHKKIGLVTYDTSEIGFERYLPFYFFPECTLAIGISVMNDSKAIYIRASQNPWKENIKEIMEKINLGEIFKKYGGGGHNRVGSLFCETKEVAIEKMQKIILEVESRLEK